MIKRLKRFSAAIVSLCMFVLMTTGVIAGQKEVDISIDEYSIASIMYDGETLEVPVLRQTIQQRSGEGIISSTETVFVPDMTEETLARNEAVVQQIKTYGAPIKTRGYGDFYVSGYIWFHSTLNYNTSYYESKPLYKMISFKLEREVYTEAPFRDFHKADARVLQVGTPGYGINPSIVQAQVKDYSQIEYNRLYTVPSDWIAVGNTGGPLIGVKYSVVISYGDGTDSVLEYFHQTV